MKLHIYTQDQENYGYKWKMKGSTDFIIDIDGFRWDEEFAEKELRMIVDELRTFIEEDSESYKSHVIGWGPVEDTYMTEFEMSQLEYDGEVSYPAIRKTYSEMLLHNI